MVRIATVLIACFLLASTSRAQFAVPSQLSGGDEARGAASEFLEASGASETMVAVIDAMRKQLIIDIQRQTSKPAEKVGRVVDELLIPEYKNRIGELNGIMADLYAVNYTVDELHRLTEFYRSPLGRRVVEQMPKISAQSVAVGQAWGVHVAQEAVKKNADELRRRGITL